MFKFKNFSIQEFIFKLKSFFIFLFFYLIFYFYGKTYSYDNLLLLIIYQTLIFLIFLISAYKIKIGFYIFIFFIPLLNSVTTILAIKNVNIILFLFFALFLGFLVNRASLVLNNQVLNFKQVNYIEKDYFYVILIFNFIVCISALITIYRYANFIPFLNGHYRNLIINLNGVNSTGAIHWTLSFLFNYLVGFGLLYVAYNSFDNIKDIIKAFYVIIGSSIIVVIFGFYQFFVNPYLGNFRHWVEAGRINSTMTDPNALGNYIIIIFPLYIAMFFYFKRWYLKIISIILILGFLMLSIFSGSRNALIGILVTLIIFLGVGISRLINKIKKRIKVSSFILIVITIILLICTILVSCDTSEIGLKEIEKPPKTGLALIDRSVDTIWMAYNTFRRVGFIDAFKSIASFREKLWRQAYNMFLDYPVTGIGLGAYIIQLPNYYEKYNIDIRHIDFTGNYYLQILSEHGLVGLFIILFFYFLIFKKSSIYFFNVKKIYPQSKEAQREDWLFKGFFISFIVMIIVLFFGPHTNFNEIQFSFFLIISMIICFIKLNSANFLKFKKVFDDKLLENKNTIRGKKIFIDKSQLISFIVVIMIFAALFFVNSWSSLSINKQQIFYGWENNYGFYKDEIVEGKKVRWTDVDASKVLNINDIFSNDNINSDKVNNERLLALDSKNNNNLHSEYNNELFLEFEIKAITPRIERIPVFVRFFYNNRLIKVVMLRDKDWHNIKLQLPDETINDKFTFTIAVSRGWIPAQWTNSSDTRRLGILITDF